MAQQGESGCSKAGGIGTRCCGYRNIYFHVGFRFSLALTVLQTKQRCKWQRGREKESQHILGNKMCLLDLAGLFLLQTQKYHFALRLTMKIPPRPWNKSKLQRKHSV